MRASNVVAAVCILFVLGLLVPTGEENATKYSSAVKNRRDYQTLAKALG
jgi:hypothetical protein